MLGPVEAPSSFSKRPELFKNKTFLYVKMKVIISVSGWGWSSHDVCHDMCHDMTICISSFISLYSRFTSWNTWHWSMSISSFHRARGTLSWYYQPTEETWNRFPPPVWLRGSEVVSFCSCAGEFEMDRAGKTVIKWESLNTCKTGTNIFPLAAM